ncbi:glycosyltransferase family 25 protein [bacterium]|nr:glycosyltransferase family 25 protein [bacterium]
MKGANSIRRTQLKIFVLNLDRAPQRRKIMLDRLAALALEAEILSAVDGKELNAADLLPGTERKLTPGEIGCYLTHVNSWKTIIQRGLSHAIVLEDDVILSPKLMALAEEVIALGMPFDVVRLSALFPIRGIPVASLSGNARLVLTTKPPSGAQGYLVSLDGAKRLLAKLVVPKLPVDVAFDRYWKYGLCMPLLFPSVVEEDKGQESTIVNRIRDTHRETIFERMTHRAEKRLRKVVANIMARRLRQYGLLKVNYKSGLQK